MEKIIMMEIGWMMNGMGKVRIEREVLGTSEYSNGDKYEGEWRGDKKNGRGRISGECRCV